jgi:hypothetical protein
MSSVISSVTLSELCFPDISGKAIAAWGQVNFAAGSYITGGIVFGLVPFADARTVDFNGFLQCEVYGEDAITASVGTYQYHYSPVGDVLQILQNGTELTNGAAIPAAVLNDVVLFHATWNRTTVLG